MEHETVISTAPQRTTRLATILADLGKDASPVRQACAAERASLSAQSCSTDTSAHPLPIADTSADLATDLSIGEILDRTQHAGFGFVVALLALVSIPLVGLTIPVGVAVAAAGAQMMAGLSQPWLPRFIRRRRITAVTLESLSRRTAHWTAKLTRVIRPRLPWLTAGPFWTLCGAGLVIQGLSLTLPIPGADWLFVVPIVLYGVGLLEGDGLLILVCHLVTLVQVVLGVVLWELIARGFADAYHWCAAVLG